MPTASPLMQRYFTDIQKEVEDMYVVANHAKARGHDPEHFVDIPLARNMAERVEGIIVPVAPQIKGKGISTRIEELEKQFGKLDWRVALTIGLEVAKQKFCTFETELKAMEVGIRVGIAYLTLGVVASPLEGFTELKLKKRRDGKEYFCLMFSGPIRSAGGTAAAVSLLLADYIRSNMGFQPYDPTEHEIQRAVTEIYDYHERVTNVQYLPSAEEIVFLLARVPVQVDGVPSEDIEVSNYKDLDRISTNRIRNGICLVLAEGLAQKAPKLHKQLSKWGASFGLDNWLFLSEFVELQKRIKAGKATIPTSTAKDHVEPDFTYIKDLVAGRPVLTYPLRAGGFRLRYGRGRTTGYSSAGIHPATMVVLNDYIAIGTQLKVERPGKAATINSIDTIEGPIVRLTNGNVVRLDSISEAKKYLKEIEEILFLGDILFNHGDFYNRAHKLLPPGYCEEWWVLELGCAVEKKYGALDLEQASAQTHVAISTLSRLFNHEPMFFVSGTDAVVLSTTFNVPLHPRYTPHFRLITSAELHSIASACMSARIEEDQEAVTKIIIPYTEALKKIFDVIGLLHSVVLKEFIVIEKDDAATIHSIFFFKSPLEIMNIIGEHSQEPTLNIMKLFSSVPIRDKSGYFIGARMGRPEKSKIRKLTGSPHVLFPVGEEGGRLRSFQAAMQDGKVTADFPLRYCLACMKETIYALCERCNASTEQRYFCKECGVVPTKTCRHGETKTYSNRALDINYYFKNSIESLKLKAWPDLIKGVRGTSNKSHMPEHLIKGILRAKHELAVNKDGTIRYDMTQMPLTHFKPHEIRTSIQTLHRLGYLTDINGKPLIQEEQILELKPQDVVLPACTDAQEEGADTILLRSAQFCDDLLMNLYGEKPYYGISTSEGLAGQLVVALAPHTSAGIVARVIGFSKTQAFYAHPMIHAATRRDCLGPEAYVPLKEDGTWRIQKIKQTINRFNPKDCLDLYGTLGKKLEKANIWSNPGEKKVVQATKHTPTDLYRVHSEDGRTLDVTGNHKLFTKGNMQKKVNALSVGDKITVCYRRDIEEQNIRELFLPDFFNDRNIMFRGITPYLKTLTKLSKHSNYVFRDSYPLSFVTKILEKHGKTLYDLPGTVSISRKRDRVSLPLRIPLSTDLLEVFGLYIAEGHARKNSSSKGFYQIGIAGRENVKQKVKNVFASHFKLKPSYENKDQVYFSSGLIYDLFVNHLEMGERAHKKRIPSLFLNLKKEKIAALLRGYYEGDGSVSKSDIRVTCDTVSEGLLHDLSFVLSRFGIFTKFYTYEKIPGHQVRNFYIKKGRKIPTFKITKVVIPSNFVKNFSPIGFLFPRKNKILTELIKKNPTGMVIDADENYAYPKVTKIEQLPPTETYCFNVHETHRFFANDILVNNCDGDEASVTLLLDVLLNFSRSYLPNSLGATQDAPLVITSILVPSEVDDMVFDVDVASTYGLAFYEAACAYKNPWEVSIDKIGNRLNTAGQYEGMMFTHDTASLNNGVLCSSYKTIPSMQDKLLGQMELAGKIRAVDKADVARLVIEKHFLPDIKGNLRKFSQQEFRCVACNEKFRRPPLRGNCLHCGGKLIFTVSEGNITKYLEPSISMAKMYNLPAYLIQTLELTQQRIESVFGRDKDKQEGLGKWFG